MPAQNIPGLMLDRAHPLSRGLVGWWPMNEGGGTRINDLVSGNYGTFGSGITQSTTAGWSGGPFGRSVGTDAVDDIITVPHSAALALTGDMTISTWLYTRLAAGPTYQAFSSKGVVGVGYASPWIAMIWTDATIIISYGNGAGAANVWSTGGTVPSTQWFNLSIVRKGTAVTFYKNGAQLGAAGDIGAQAVADAGTAYLIGGRTPGTLYGMNGWQCHHRLYNRALGVSEIEQLYTDPLAGALAPSRVSRFYVAAVAPPPAAPTHPMSADRLYNRSSTRIWRRGETG
jgi:hypothetical protein